MKSNRNIYLISKLLSKIKIGLFNSRVVLTSIGSTKTAALMAPKRRTTEVPTINKRQRIQVHPGVEDLNTELRLNEQERTDRGGALDRPPQFTREQLRTMELQSDARHPGRPLAPSDGVNDASDSQAARSFRSREELREDFGSSRHFESPARTLSAAALKQNRSETSVFSRF